MAKVTIHFHKPGHKWFLAPDFTSVALNDESTVEYAVNLVLSAKRKSIMPGEKDALVNKICRTIKSDTVGALRELDDDGWKGLEVPLICRVYLRHLVEQSVSLTNQQLLECDFNSGLPFDWKAVQEKVTQLLALGFTRDDAIEAILVSGNKQVDAAAQYLLADPETRRMERERAKKKFNKCVPPNRHYTIIEQQKKDKAELRGWLKKTPKELELECIKLKRTLLDERRKRESLEKKRDEIAKANQLALYLEFLRGVVSDPTINATETQRIDDYRQQRNITKKDHNDTISKLGFSEETFDKMKNFDTTGGGKYNDECLVCYEPPKDHMILPCHHVCLCGDCAEEYREFGDEGKCPLCDKQIQEIKQIFYFGNTE